MRGRSSTAWRFTNVYGKIKLLSEIYYSFVHYVLEICLFILYVAYGNYLHSGYMMVDGT